MIDGIVILSLGLTMNLEPERRKQYFSFSIVVDGKFRKTHNCTCEDKILSKK